MSIGLVEIIIGIVILIAIVIVTKRLQSRDEGAQVNISNDAETVNSRDIEMGKWIVIEMIISVVLIFSCIYGLYTGFDNPFFSDNFAGSPVFFFLIGWLLLNIWRLFQLYNLKKLY